MRTAVPAHPNPYNVYGAQYPRIEEDNRVTFHFTAPNAQKVQVALVTSGQGSLSPLPYDMIKGADGVWTYTSVPQSPGYHNYWMLVDGAIVLDPATKAFMGYSHMCNGFEIPEAGVDWYDLKDVPHGHLEAANYFAKSIHAWRHIFVYTPPGYDDKANFKTRYPVVYLQHGSGEDETVWFEMGRTNLVLDNLLAAGKVKPMIVVSETSIIAGAGGRGAGPGAPALQAARRGAGFGGGPGGGAYGQLMTNELIPWVDSHFRTLADRDHRAMGGLSMGGGITAAVTMVNLDKFSYIGLFSGGSAAGFGGAWPWRGGARRNSSSRARAAGGACHTRPQDCLQRRNGRSGGVQPEGQGSLHELRHGTPARESRRPEKTPGTTDRCRHHEQLHLLVSRHHARMADVAKELLYFRSASIQVVCVYPRQDCRMGAK